MPRAAPVPLAALLGWWDVGEALAAGPCPATLGTSQCYWPQGTVSPRCTLTRRFLGVNPDEQGCFLKDWASASESLSASGRMHVKAFPRQRLLGSFSQSWSGCRGTSGSNLELWTPLRLVMLGRKKCTALLVSKIFSPSTTTLQESGV